MKVGRKERVRKREGRNAVRNKRRKEKGRKKRSRKEEWIKESS
jgi:hypothetical protein